MDEYYKGDGPLVIPIMLSAPSELPSADAIRLEDCASYVLFLFQPDSAEGRSYWDGGYLVQGLGQGVWTVNGNSAVRGDGTGEIVELSRFNALIPAPDRGPSGT